MSDAAIETKSSLHKESLEWAAHVFTTNLNGIIIANSQAIILDVNPAFTKITGYEKDEVLGKNPKILASGKHTKEFYTQMWNSLLHSGFWSGEIINRKKCGELYHEMLTISIVRDKTTNQIKNYIGTFSDISSVKKYQKSLIEETKQAEAANNAKSRFLAMMSHEVRTPLNGILGMAQLLATPNVGEQEQKECVQAILKSGNTLLTLLNDVLDLTKVESGKIDFEYIAFNPQQIIFETKALYSEIARSKSLQLKEKWHGEPHQLYVGDPYRIRQMISNLLNNSIKFTQSGQIQIEAKEIERQHKSAVLEFSFLDTGIGIAADNLRHIFEPFSQEDNSITRKYGGTGLGLSIVAHLAQAMGGHVGVESIQNQGSRFWFRLPLGVVLTKKSIVSSQKYFENQPDQWVSTKYKVHNALVVDDDLTNRLVIVKMLSRLGIYSTVAENGQSAVELISSGEKFDLVLMDLQMPVMDGNTATKLIRRWENNVHQPKHLIVAFTADAYSETKVRCLSLGMNDVLTKPVSFGAIKNMIEKHFSIE